MRIATIAKTSFSLGIPDDQPELVKSQLVALKRGIPLLYFILTLNSLIFSRMLDIGAPYVLAVVVPQCLAGACILRGAFWYARRPVFSRAK